jgi:hypothetical protein
LQKEQQACGLPQGDHRQGDLPDEHGPAEAAPEVERRSEGHSTGTDFIKLFFGRKFFGYFYILNFLAKYHPRKQQI